MIGLLSDSHGDLDAFDAAFELLKAKGARRFIFAGGAYADLDAWLARRAGAKGEAGYSDADFLADVTNFLSEQAQVDRPPAFFGSAEVTTQAAGPAQPPAPEKLSDRFLRVPDRESPEYASGAAPKKAMDMIGDALCCVVHDKNELDRDDLLNATIFVHGGETEPKVVQIGPRFFLTPGRLSGAQPPTCALVEIVDRNLRFSAFALDGRTVVDGQVLAIDRRTKLTVK